ncbi:MAG TPA: hypothetical protein PLQ45_03580 [Anaerohalosphaeraceae bacterium]|nr:hypothetical protein [Anaerohalosphaeraceae bacterium]
MNIRLKHRCFKTLLFTFLALSVPSWASVFAPDWRGEDKTVYAEWDNWVPAATYPGDLTFYCDYKEFGAGARKTFTPHIVQFAAQISGQPAETLAAYDNRLNVLKLNTEGLYVSLPNFLEGEQYTRVRFEICYLDTYASFADFQIWGLMDSGSLPGYDDGPIISPAPVQSVRDGSWVTEVYEFVIQPSPLWETIFLRFDHYPTSPQNPDAPYIDYLSVDTICVPEPTGVLLLAAGALFLRRSGR